MINKENKNKVFLLIITILVVANIGMLAFFLQKKESPRQAQPRQDRKAYIADFLKKEIGFDTLQLQQFDTLSARHREKMGSMFEKMKGNKDEQFKQLVAGNFTDSAINAVADQSATSQKAMEIIMFNHLKNIRLLCKPVQQPKFDSLFGKVLNRRGEGRREKKMR